MAGELGNKALLTQERKGSPKLGPPRGKYLIASWGPASCSRQVVNTSAAVHICKPRVVGSGWGGGWKVIGRGGWDLSSSLSVNVVKCSLVSFPLHYTSS